ncbi:hypothetical protein [Paenibacillus donghaensis]|uniref:hypothetical protein n=1 Tax=Paenibacillus donghaensis TaxID=414771 RepID=UPI0014720125|nr:hypothetical protein [Paenibacillus donghaensis]
MGNPSFYPEIALGNLDGKGEDEFVLILTTGTGTGVHESEVHVLTREMAEIPVVASRSG